MSAAPTPTKPVTPCWRQLGKSLTCGGTLEPIVTRGGALIGYRCRRCAAHVSVDDHRVTGGDR